MAIVQPNEMKFEDKKFSMIIVGAPGVGKTTLALSAPDPILLDLDKGISRVKAQHRTVASMVDTYEELLEDLKSEAFQRAKTIVVDTGGALVTLMQDYAIRKDAVNRTKSGTISIKGFGAVKSEFQSFVNKVKTVYNKNVIFIFHSVEEKDKDGNPIVRLMCEGSARNLVWQPCDLGCYVYMENGNRVAGFTPTDSYFAKGCYGINGLRQIPALADNSKNDYITRLFDEARENIAKEGEYFTQQKEIYDAAIKAGAELVEKVVDIESANNFTAEFKKIAHALTSQVEIKAMFREKIDSLGIAWNGQAKRYEQTKKEEVKEEKGGDDASETKAE